MWSVLAQNGRKIYTKTLSMASGATIHHSMLRQLCLYSSSRFSDTDKLEPHEQIGQTRPCISDASVLVYFARTGQRTKRGQNTAQKKYAFLVPLSPTELSPKYLHGFPVRPCCMLAPSQPNSPQAICIVSCRPSTLYARSLPARVPPNYFRRFPAPCQQNSSAISSHFFINYFRGFL